jgi:two-component system chemotaxis response regulator CheB
MNLRVLVVDDTIVYRTILSDILSEVAGVEVVGTAANGRIALSRIKSLKPDLLTLDIEMPEMNGLEVLEAIGKESLDAGAIVLSSLTVKGGEMTLKALEVGAFDFITKPDCVSAEESKGTIKKSLIPLLQAYARKKEIQSILRGKPAPSGENKIRKESVTAEMTSVVQRMGSLSHRIKSEVVAIGVSTGGPNALGRMLPALPKDMNVPVFIVQHMPPLFTLSLAQSLDAKCAIKVKEGEDGEPIQSNIAYIAPGGRQMKVVLGGADGGRKLIRITDDPPENNCKPSVDYLFRSVSHHYLGRATGVILTGMGNDGTLGLKLMKRNGAISIAQDEASCVVFGMPKEAIEAKVVDIIAPLDRIASEIIKTVK